MLDAEDKLTALEYAEFVNIRDKIAKEITRMKQTAHGLSRIDVLCSLAEVADRGKLCYAPDNRRRPS